MKNPRIVTLIAIIMIAAISRLVPHPWNASPIMAIALFAGATFSNKKFAFTVPLVAMLLSDVVIGFYPTWPVTYFCFMVSVVIGQRLMQTPSFTRVAGGTLAASSFFFVVTNFVCWLTMPEYTKDLSGLGLCYFRAVPFFRNALLADMVFSALLFGSFGLSERLFPALRRPATISA